MRDASPHLHVDGEARVEFVAGLGEEAHGEFLLEHEDAGTGRIGEGEEFEDEGGGDLVGGVGYADTRQSSACRNEHLIG